MNERKKLSDILRGSDRDALAKQWQDTEAAKDLAPLPRGEYLFRIVSGELFNAKSGTPGYKLTLEVIEGEHEGRRVWHDLWLTAAALAMTKRDLAKIGVTDEAKAQRRAAVANGTPTLNRQTLDFIRDGAAVGDRHRLLFSAAANLAEFGCPPSLAHALLTEAGLDSGLPPSDVRRQIDCGLAHAKGTTYG